MGNPEYDWADFDELDYELDYEDEFTPTTINVFGEEDEDDYWEEENEDLEGMLYEASFEF
jgi:hypothetical protein